MHCDLFEPTRTKLRSVREPVAIHNASRMMDFPAPVSPVKAVKPELKSISKASIKTTLRIDKLLSICLKKDVRLDDSSNLYFAAF